MLHLAFKPAWKKLYLLKTLIVSGWTVLSDRYQKPVLWQSLLTCLLYHILTTCNRHSFWINSGGLSSSTKIAEKESKSHESPVKKDFTLHLFPELISYLPAALEERLSLLFKITDLEFWLISVIHYKEVDRTLSLNQFDSPTLSIDSRQTRSGVRLQIEKQINKKLHWENSRIFCDISAHLLKRTPHSKEISFFTMWSTMAGFIHFSCMPFSICNHSGGHRWHWTWVTVKDIVRNMRIQVCGNSSDCGLLRVLLL